MGESAIVLEARVSLLLRSSDEATVDYERGISIVTEEASDTEYD